MVFTANVFENVSGKFLLLLKRNRIVYFYSFSERNKIVPFLICLRKYIPMLKAYLVFICEMEIFVEKNLSLNVTFIKYLLAENYNLVHFKHASFLYTQVVLLIQSVN